MNSSPQRLAVLVSSMLGGGAARAMLKVANGIADCGHSVDLVLPRMSGPYLADLRPSVRAVDLRAGRVLRSLPALVRYLRRERPQAMISALDYVNIVALWARRLARVPTRLVVSERNTLSLSAAQSERFRARLMPHLVKRFYPWADAVVAVSEGVADDLARVTGLPRDRVQVIYNPVVTPELRERARGPLDHPWFRPGEPPVVLAVGRLAPQKDFVTLIEAFARARQRRTARLLILGDGALRSELEALIRERGLERDVSLPGFDPNPYPYMSRAALFVLSSRWEGLPGVLIEALCCGPPVVATDCPSGPREILEGGKHGGLVPVGDVAALAGAIERALAGQLPPPTSESWQRFELSRAVSQYIAVALGR